MVMNMDKSCKWVCVVSLALIVLATFPGALSQEQNITAANSTDCSNITSDNCCNTTSGNSSCSLCSSSGDAEATCRSVCLETEQDTCVAPPPPTTQAPATCANLTGETCCNTTGLNCSLCQAGDAAGVCKAVCDDGETDTCAAEPVGPTTAPTPTTTTPQGNGTTGAPTDAPTAAPTTNANKGGHGGQSFDAASFVGGIILSIGILAIAFFALKFYKSRRDQVYHTL